MKITQQDIKKYGTLREQRFLRENAQAVIEFNPEQGMAIPVGLLNLQTSQALMKIFPTLAQNQPFQAALQQLQQPAQAQPAQPQPQAQAQQQAQPAAPVQQ